MKNDFSLRLLCEVLDVSRSGYHAWASGQRGRRESRDQELLPKIILAFTDSRQSHGYPRMTRELRAQGERVSKARVARLMQSEGLQGRQRRAYRPQKRRKVITTAPSRLIGSLRLRPSPRVTRFGKPTSPT